MSYSSEVLADTPVAYWRMNESSGNPQDSSGNAHHVNTIVGSPTYSQSSPITSDGTAKSILLPNGVYFESPDHAAYDVSGGSPNNAFTLEAWVKRTDTNADCCIISKQPTSYAMKIYASDDKLHMTSSQTAEICISSGTVNETSNWHHCVVSYDNNSEATNVYIDNVEQGVDSFSPGAGPFVGNNASVLQIGKDNTGTSGNLYVCEVAIYIGTSGLSSSRVAAHFNAAAAAAGGGSSRMTLMGVG